MPTLQEDEAAILALIHANRIAIWTGNFADWEECFVHAPYTSRWGWWRTGGIFVRTGWDQLRQRVGLDRLGVREDYAYDTKVVNLNLRVDGNMAWATFEQHYPGYDDEGHVGPGLVYEARVFERHEGRWRIALLCFLDASFSRRDRIMLRLDAEGDVLWSSPAALERLDENDDVVIRNNRLRFRSTEIDLRFRAALRWANSLDTGLMSRHGALPIVVEAGEGVPSRIYWVIRDAGMNLLSLDETSVDETSLAAAAAIYGLSATQTRVAAYVAEGKSLPEIAEAMEISPNTARTHLQRIFDKTGVRTQPALVRVLLSVVSPV